MDDRRPSHLIWRAIIITLLSLCLSNVTWFDSIYNTFSYVVLFIIFLVTNINIIIPTKKPSILKHTIYQDSCLDERTSTLEKNNNQLIIKYIVSR